MQTRLEANPQEIAKVLEVLKRHTPRGGANDGQIEEETGYRIHIIKSAIAALRKQGIVQGYDLLPNPDAVDADTDGAK